MTSLSGFIRRMVRAYWWMKAVQMDRRQEFDRALVAIRKIATYEELKPHHLALLGSVQVARNDSGVARQHFERAEQMTRNKADAESRYVNIYSKAYLKLMNGDEPIEDLIQASHDIPCRSSLKRVLPLRRRA